jgi:hypothetical protein
MPGAPNRLPLEQLPEKLHQRQDELGHGALHVLWIGVPTSRTRRRNASFQLLAQRGPPLFIHQMSHLWLDFRGIHDDFNGKVGIDYFDSQRATYVQRHYDIDNPLGFSHYHRYGWGFTASDGPGPAVREVNGVRRVFYDYVARGAPFGPDDGSIAPWGHAI